MRTSPLTENVRRHLLDRVEKTRRTAPNVIPVQPLRPVRGPTDFTTLPGYDEFRAQRRLAAIPAIGSPFFRVHEARAGARTRIDGHDFLNFASYDYLGLNEHPEVMAAAKAAVDRYGVSASGSHHVSGGRDIHRDLEAALARHYGVEDAIVMVSGHATNVGVIGQLMGPKDLIVHDELIHNSALTGAQLSGAARRSFPHNDLDALDRLLTQVRGRFERALVVVEGLYSMDGDYPDLARLIEIKTRHRAWLMVDEAHALGVLGARGAGSFEQCGIDPRDVDIWMGTLSKTLAACGGYIAGSHDLVYYLRCSVGAFVYSVALPPAIAAAAATSLDILHREPEQVAQLKANAALFDRLAREKGLDTGKGLATAVRPVIIGDSLAAVVLGQSLFQSGLNVIPVTHPGVPEGTARLRFFITRLHTEDDIAAAVEMLTTAMDELPDLVASVRAEL